MCAYCRNLLRVLRVALQLMVALSIVIYFLMWHPVRGLLVMAMRFILIFMVSLAALPGSAISKDVARACLKSERGAGQQKLCRCVQKAADQTLTRKDQKRAVEFFADPDLAQSVRRSDSRRDERFWDRYESFGETARKYCRKR